MYNSIDMRKDSVSRKVYILSLIMTAAAVGLYAAARLHPGFAEWYSANVYPLLLVTVGRAAGLVPVSVSELICAVLPAVLLLDIILLIRRRRVSARPFMTFMKHILLIVSLLMLLYSAGCGVNYYRQPFIDRSSYESAEFTSDELEEFCRYAADQINISSENSDHSPYIYPQKNDLADSAVRAMQILSAADMADCSCSSLMGFYPRPKQLTFLSRFFSMMGVSGIYSPFTIEANINGEMTDLEKPFTACHELSHLKGFMNEGEANYIGWLACIGSDDPAFNRSGWLIAWIYAGNSLYSADPEKYAAVRLNLPHDALTELEENSRFWDSRRNSASDIQDKVNDAYLKSNGQDQGIRTYNQLTEHMLMWYRQNKKWQVQ